MLGQSVRFLPLCTLGLSVPLLSPLHVRSVCPLLDFEQGKPVLPLLSPLLVKPVCPLLPALHEQRGTCCTSRQVHQPNLCTLRSWCHLPVVILFFCMVSVSTQMAGQNTRGGRGSNCFSTAWRFNPPPTPPRPLGLGPAPPWPPLALPTLTAPQPLQRPPSLHPPAPAPPQHGPATQIS